MAHKKNVIITGASSGLGKALAHGFAKIGFNLTLSARREERLNALRDDLIKAYPNIEICIVPADISSKDSSALIVEKSLAHFSRIDVVIANAGQGMWSRFRDVNDPDLMKDLMDINYMGVVYGLHYSLPHLRKSEGSFIAISSIQGVIPVAFHTGYVASKFAVNGLIETIRLEEPNVHFLLALPSWISGTELRAHALSGSADGSIKVKLNHGNRAVSAEDCAAQIIDAWTNKKREVFIPNKYRCVPLLRNLFKSTFDSVVMSKVKTQLKD